MFKLFKIVNECEKKNKKKKKVGFELIIETAKGLINVNNIASASNRTESLHFGAADFAASIGAKTMSIGGTNNFYGTLSPLNNIALISAPDAHLITIQPYDPNALEAIEKAITSSDVNLTPNNDGSIIRLSVPPLTEERRKDLVKLVHKVIEDGRISIRNIRRDSNDTLKAIEKKHEISEDNLKRCLDNIQELTDDFIKKLNTIQDDKEKEILS